MTQHQAIGLLAAIAAAFMLLAAPEPASAQNACLQQCGNTFETCKNNCASTAGTNQAATCMDSCFHGYEGCKSRCGSSSLDQFLGMSKAGIQLAAGGNPVVCKANLDQCVKACDGAQQCTNQCNVNYQGCLGN